jgi:hypothetical protein
MFPNTFEAWGFILGSCFISFMIGQWLRRRRKKVKTHDVYVEGLKRRVLAETLAQKKKANKKKTGKLKKKPVI